MSKERELLKKALEALKIGFDLAYAEAVTFHAKFAGYKETEHKQLDEDVKQIKDAIQEIEAELANPGPETKWFVVDRGDNDQTLVTKETIAAMPDWYKNKLVGIYPVLTNNASPIPMQRLTDDEILNTLLQNGLEPFNYMIKSARAIETALIEKNSSAEVKPVG